MSRLINLLRQQMESREWSAHQLQQETKKEVTRGAIEAILSGKTKIPALSTMNVFARIFDVPLWVWVDAVGYDLGFVPPGELSESRAAALARAVPEFSQITEYLANADMDTLRGVLSFLEIQVHIRQQNGV